MIVGGTTQDESYAHQTATRDPIMVLTIGSSVFVVCAQWIGEFGAPRSWREIPVLSARLYTKVFILNIFYINSIFSRIDRC
jgi:hypothetical protein